MNGEHNVWKGIFDIVTVLITLGFIPLLRWIVLASGRLATVETTSRDLQRQLEALKPKDEELSRRMGEAENKERDSREEILGLLGKLTQEQALTTQALRHIRDELRRRNGVAVNVENRDGQEER